MKSFTFPRQGMSCAAHNAIQVRYDLLIGKSGRAWLVPEEGTPNRANEIHCTNSADWTKKGMGYGGGSLKLPLTQPPVLSDLVQTDVVIQSGDGSWYFELRGGWHTKANALYEDTGFDIRCSSVTLVAIGRWGRYGGYGSSEDATVVHDVLYVDPEPLEGHFERGEHLAKGLANALGYPVYVGVQSAGGGRYGWEYPDGKSSRDYEFPEGAPPVEKEAVT